MNMKHLFISLAATLSVIAFASPAFAESGWLMHGKGLGNAAEADTSINRQNVRKAELESIYDIDVTNAGGKVRGENAVGSGFAVTDGGIAYVPTTDGRIHVLDLKKDGPPNADGTESPAVVDIYDLVADPRYLGASASDGDDIVMNRMQPTLAEGNIYAGNYNLFLAGGPDNGFSNDLMGVPTLFNGLAFQSQGAVLLSIDADTGDLNWKTVIDDNPHSMITNSVTVHDGVVYAGLSTEMSGSLGLIPFSYDLAINFAGVDPFLGLDANGASLPTNKSGVLYRNAIVALDEATGVVLWKTFVMPEQAYRSFAEIDATGRIDLWNGGSSWGGGNFPIDAERGLIFVGTGEAYNAPSEAEDCELTRLQTQGGNPFSDECLDIDQDGQPIEGPIRNVASGTPGVSSSSHPLTDSVIALDIETGEIRWAKRLQGFDVWNFACLEPVFGAFLPADNLSPACPEYLRPSNGFFGLNFFAKDLDVGEQPMLVKRVKMGGPGGPRDLLIVTSKAANVWAFDPETGEEIWKTAAAFGPGSLFGGGILWGSATDGERIYLTSTTSNLHVDSLDDPALAVVPGSCPLGAFDGDGNLSGGVYGALDLATGEIAWQRCLTAATIDLATGNPILDDDGEEMHVAGFNEGPVSVGGGVVYVPGPTTTYGFVAPDVGLRAQVVALDAKTGALLKRLPFNADGEPSATRMRFTRTAITENRIVIGNGLKDDFGSTLARRVVTYKIDDD
jgi:outer membrane protein assembly factor BamB